MKKSQLKHRVAELEKDNETLRKHIRILVEDESIAEVNDIRMYYLSMYESERQVWRNAMDYIKSSEGVCLRHPTVKTD